jgi:subtilisin-like proprotein convertase family protein
MQFIVKPFLFFLLIFASAPTNSFGQNDASPCDLPANINIKSITLNSARISWKNNESVRGWIIKWRIQDEQYIETNTSDLIDTNFYIIQNLLPNTKYFFKIKSVCDGSESNWSNDYTFVTNLTNPSVCNMSLPIRDPAGNNQQEKTYFYIQCDDYPSKKLGEDVFIQKIRLIIKHDWTSDLDIKLTSPSGKSFFLIKSLQVNNLIGFGNPNDTECSEVLAFSDNACEKLADSKTTFTGEFIPKEPISSVYDETSPNGIWTLEITDKLKNNAGVLKYFNIEFAPIICPILSSVTIIPTDDKALAVNWKTNEYIDSVFIRLIGNNQIKTFITFSSGSYNIENLVPDTEYSIALQSKCYNFLSAFSCDKKISTLCNFPSLRETFDNNEVCEDPCFQDCLQSDLWFNNYYFDKKWIALDKTTKTENTGPDSDVYGNGKYIYLESSAGQCENDTMAILQSTCLKINESLNGCDMSFYYNMYGVDIASLILEISENGGLDWIPLFYIEGNQGNKWIKKEIDLNNYSGKICIFRFIGKVRKDRSFGDVAIDDIIFYNASKPIVSDYTFYPDRDNDGFGKDTSGIFVCYDSYQFHVKNNLDCNDNDKFINPEAEEINCNFVDENCNGMQDDAAGEKPLTVKLISIINAFCLGINDGSIILSVQDGIPPYNFIWSNGSTDSVLVDVGKGAYNCLITDQTGCGIRTQNYQINQNGNMLIEASSIKHTQCNGKNDGEIEISVFGGIPPFSYFWSNNETTKNINNLGSGHYNITVTDSTGCFEISKDFEIQALATFNAGILQIVEPSCFGGNDGRIELKVTNGKPPYEYLWSNGANTALNTNLKTGQYFCTITDSENCTQVYGPVVLNEPDLFKVQITSIDNVTCIGEENGSIEISAKGGIAPYSFQWLSYDHDDFISFNDDIYNLRSGMYTLHASDLHGCQVLIDSIDVITIDSIEVEVDELTDAACARSDEGYISLKAAKGYQNYYYFWSENSRESFIDSLSAGSYSVTVTDDLGCKFVLNNIEINSLNMPLNVELQILNSIACHGTAVGKLKALAESENKPFDFNWSAGIRNLNMEPQDIIDKLPAGNYNVTVTDNYGCVGTSNDIIIDQPPRIQISDVVVTEIFCYSDNTGIIEIEVNGGVQPYVITWNEGLYSGNKIIKLIAGNYQASVIDRNGCIFLTDTVYLTQPDEINVKIVTMDAHKGSSDGSAILLVEGGVSPYEIVWDANAKDQIGAQAFNLAKGWYNATITDDNGCVKTVLVFINETTVSVKEGIEDQIFIYPNPAKDVITIESSIEDQDIIDVCLYNLNGTKMRDLQLFDFKHAYKLLFDKLNSGMYILKIDTGRQQYFKKVIILN